MEPHCLFHVLRDGPRIALASLAANGHLLCASSTSDRLGLTPPCRSGESWTAAGAAWEQRDGTILNARWPDKASGWQLDARGWAGGRLWTREGYCCQDSLLLAVPP